MLNSRWVIGICMVLLTLLSVNCAGKGGDALTPSTDCPRSYQSFNSTGSVFPLPPAEDEYLGVDLAVVRNGDYPINIDVGGDDMKLTAMVSLEIEEIAGDPPYTQQTPSLAWLGEVAAGQAPDVIEEITFGTVGGQTLDYRNVHVAAWYDGSDMYPKVEVAVSFEWHFYYNGAWLPWAPGIWFMQWQVSAFSDGTPGSPTAEHWFLPKPTGWPGVYDNMNCWGQDIAVDPGTGDIYLLYINQDNIFNHPYRSHFFVLNEGASFTWSKAAGCPWEAFDYDWQINCWTPSIDVGKVKIGNGSADWGVAIAFTAQDMYFDGIDNIAPLCTVGTGWYLADNDEVHPGEDAQVIPGTYDADEQIYYYCGAPSIDIAPEGNYDPWWAIAYVQEVEDAWDYDVMFIDSVNLAAVRLHDTNDTKGKFGASVTCHINYNYRIASVSVYEESIYGYQPAAAGFNVGTEGWSENYTRVQTGLPAISGTFDPFDILQNNPGISTSIVSNSTDGKYYLGFSSNIEPTPCSIYAACGNTTE